MKKLRKKADKKIWELHEVLTKLPIYPNSFTYVNMYQSIQQLYHQEKYNLVIKLCDVLIEDM